MSPMLKPAVARPFLKWVGGKTQLLPALVQRMPTRFGTYFEPFVGGGALFFTARPRKAVLCDANERLVRTYRAVRDDVEGVIEAVESYAEEHRKDAKRAYYLQRENPPDDDPENDDVSVAGWMIYLNKTGFNGLYRVNRKGQYNNPIGRLSNRAARTVIVDAANLRACAAALAGVEVVHSDFRGMVDAPVAGDFVYLDPPYVPVSETAKFTAYTKDKFTAGDQMALAEQALSWKRRGVHILLSNSSSELCEKLYEPRGFRVDVVAARRNINAKGSGRGAVAELLVY